MYFIYREDAYIYIYIHIFHISAYMERDRNISKNSAWKTAGHLI